MHAHRDIMYILDEISMPILTSLCLKVSVFKYHFSASKPYSSFEIGSRYFSLKTSVCFRSRLSQLNTCLRFRTTVLLLINLFILEHGGEM